MEHGTKNEYVVGYAKMFGVSIQKLEYLEQKILNIPYMTEVDFDAAPLEGKQLCVLVGYDIPVGATDYWVLRSDFKRAVIKSAKECGLNRTEDVIEDYGEHFYFVFDASAWF